MLSKIKKVFICLLFVFLIFPLISCKDKEEKATEAKYELIETIMMDEVIGEEDSQYGYYYITFDNGVVTIDYNTKEDNKDMQTIGSYEKRENVYVANIEGLTVNYEIKNDTDLECKMFGMTLKFKLVTE